MAELKIEGAKIYYTDTKCGDETILFSHGFLMNHHMFDKQIDLFKSQYRCIAFDWPGQGKSGKSKTGYGMEDLYQHILNFIEKLDLKPFHWVGVSMGGFIGMRLAARRPDLIKSMVLAETSAEIEKQENIRNWKKLAYLFLLLGGKTVVNPVIKILFGEKILNDPRRKDFIDEIRSNIISLNRLATFKTAQAIVNRHAMIDELQNITAPTLIITGDQDQARTYGESLQMQKIIQGAELAIISGAGHSSSVEEPELFNRTLEKFYANL